MILRRGSRGRPGIAGADPTEGQTEEQARARAENQGKATEQAPEQAPVLGPATAPPPDSRPDNRVPALLRHSPFAIGFFGALGALVAVFLTEQVRSISGSIILIVMALFLAIGLTPLVEWFMRRGVRRGFSVALVLVVVLAFFTLFIVAIAPVVGEQIASISRSAPGWLDDLQSNDRIQDIEQKYDLIGRARDYITSGSFGQSVFGGALGVGLAVLSAVANSFIVIILMIYFLASMPSIKNAAYDMAPASRRARVSELGDRILRSIGAYVGGAFVVALMAGVSTLVFTAVVGLGDYSFALAFVVALLSLIPVVGSIISGAIITLLGFTISPTTALICLVYYVAYQQVEAYFIYPRIMTRSVEIPGSVTVIAALVGGALLGVVGAILAVPVAASLLLLHREVFLKRQDAR